MLLPSTGQSPGSDAALAGGGEQGIDRVDDLVEDRVLVAGLELRLLRPRDLDALVDERAFREAEFLPYWAELWPSGRALAEALPALLPNPSSARVLEIGCGLGLPSLVSALRGAHVDATDWAAQAIALLRRNARRNGASLEAETVDWSSRTWFSERGPWDLVLAADVLYERRHVAPLLDLLPGLAPEVLLADPGRQPLGDFLEGAEDQWEIEDVDRDVMCLRARRLAAAQCRRKDLDVVRRERA